MGNDGAGLQAEVEGLSCLRAQRAWTSNAHAVRNPRLSRSARAGRHVLSAASRSPAGCPTPEPLSGTVTFLFTDIEGSTSLLKQHSLADHEWPDSVELRVRIGIHSGEASAAGERYAGLWCTAQRASLALRLQADD